MNRKLLASIFAILTAFLFLAPTPAIAQTRCTKNSNCYDDSSLEGCVPAPAPRKGMICTYDPDENISNSTGNALESEALNDALYDFCQKRQGDTMNLETWYAGKCGANNTFTDEGTGFGDIIILHALEFLIGEQEKTGDAIIKEILKKIEKNQQGQSQPLTLFATIDITNQALNSSTSNDNLLSGFGQLISLPFKNPPAQTHQYIASVKSNLARHKLVSPAYAKDEGGYGFSHLQGFLPIWRAFRNIAYLIFVLLFLVYGFMIMFRVKINPQTSVNIQQALPKLIVTLLLITFSYAIVGLMFDLIWLLFFLGFSALETFGVIGIKWWPDVLDFSKHGNIFTNLASGRAGLIFSWIWNSFIAFFSGIPAAIGAIAGIGSTIPMIAWIGAFGLFFSTTIPIIIGVIFLIATLYTYGKLLFKLIGAYITVVINLIFAPLILLGNIFPGSNSVGNWLRNTFANLIVFPVTGFFLLFSYIFMIQPLLDKFSTIFQTQQLATNAVRVPVLFPFQIGGAPSIYALVGLGLLFMSPKYVDMVRDAFQVEPFKYGVGLGELMPGIIKRPIQEGTGRFISGEISERLRSRADEDKPILDRAADAFSPKNR